MRTILLPYYLYTSLFILSVLTISSCTAPCYEHCETAALCTNNTQIAIPGTSANTAIGSVGIAKLERLFHHQCHIVKHQVNGIQVLITGGNTWPELFNYPGTFYVDSVQFRQTPISHPNYHTATNISNEHMAVLIGGENDMQVPIKSISIYSYYTSSFQDTFHIINNTLHKARSGHTATLLSDNQILIVGGAGDGSTELFNPISESIDNHTSLSTPRKHHTATYFEASNDSKVLIVGGDDNGTIERYEDGQFTVVDAKGYVTTKTGHRATWLGSNTESPSKRILITGGNDGIQTLNTFTYYDIDTHSFRETGLMSSARSQHTATLIPQSNGMVLIIGGNDGNAALESIEVYDAESNTFKMTECSLKIARYGHSATYLKDSNSILIYGGQDSGGAFVSQAELINIQDLTCFTLKRECDE